jgi:hypothetical protein
LFRFQKVRQLVLQLVLLVQRRLELQLAVE